MTDPVVITTAIQSPDFTQLANEKGVITQLAFKKRFPAAKWVAARELAKTNATLADFFDDYDKSTYIVLSRAAIKVAALMDAGWPVEVRLTQAEVDFVLLTPIMTVELPDAVRAEIGMPLVPAASEYEGYWATA